MDESKVTRVVIGMDPHKRSGDDRGDGRRRERRRRWPVRHRRSRATPRCSSTSRRGRSGSGRSRAVTGIGRHIAHRLLADGQEVVDVPAKLSARARVFATGQGRKTDATDAHSVALVGTRMAGLRPVVSDDAARGAAAAGGPAPLDR